ncbi:hypothetical protein ACHAWF_005908, partial [Thalassiosira exigua]
HQPPAPARPASKPYIWAALQDLPTLHRYPIPMADDNPRVQLGFALPLRADADGDDESNASASSDGRLELGHRRPLWSDWDGGKIGGIPSWLNPRDLPEGAPLRCRGPCSDDAGAGVEKNEKAGTILRFVAQLYCPADDATGNESAFHRSLYVFACPTCCSEQLSPRKPGGPSSAARRLSDCVQVLRSQLPKRNDFYPARGNDGGVAGEWNKHTSEYWAKSTKNDKLNLCAVCGQRSKGKCPKQQLWFCGPDHQRESLRASKEQKKQLESPSGNGGKPVRYLPSVFYESELVVEEEPITADSDVNDAAAETNGKLNSTLFPSKDIADADADASLEQSDLNALTGNTSLAQAATGVTDPATLAFYARMAIGGKENDVRDQCFRYCRWPENNKNESDQSSDDGNEEEGFRGPLWLSSDNVPPTTSPPTPPGASSFPPPCQYCGASRAFEFQILPQMLHYLLHDPCDTENGDKSGGTSRRVLTESERAILLEAKSKIESGVDLPEGFREQHEAAVMNAREALLGAPNKSNGSKGQKGVNDAGSKGNLDWGTIAVYTCTASCGDGTAYMEEAAWMQPPLD